MKNNSFIHPNARIGKNVEIGPFSYIAENVTIGDNCWIGPNVTIFDYVKIGDGCRIFPGAVVGAIPQDLKFQGEVTWVEVGNNTTIRECATINRGTGASGKFLTKVGDNCLIMSYVHIAHDCRVGNNCIFSSYAAIAGETDVDDWAILGGGALCHQFTKVGCHAMVGGASAVNKDVPPYVIAARNPVAYEGINIVGLRRRGFRNEDIEEIRNIYKTLYEDSLNFSDACRRIEEAFPDTEWKKNILDFVNGSNRGIVR